MNANEILALAALAGIGVGLFLAVGIGWAIAVVSGLVLAYIIVLTEGTP